MLPPADTGCNLLFGAREKFGGDYNLVALGKLTQCSAEILLAGATLVSNGGIEKVYA